MAKQYIMMGKRLLTVVFYSLLGVCMLGSCSDDDDEMEDICVQVAVRVDSHTPPHVTVFGERISLTNDNWRITLESFRQYQQTITVPKSRLKPVPSGPLRTDSSELDGIFSVQAVQGKRVFTLNTVTNGRTYLFVIK